jgi:PAS domain S-box-containing protein
MRIEAIMNKNPITPKIDNLRRNQKIIKRQIQSRTAELENVNESLKAEITLRKRTEEELNLLLRIAQEIGLANDFSSSVDIALRRICESTGWAVGEAWVPCSEGTALEYSRAWCAESKSFERFKELSQDFRFPPGVGLPGQVWASKRPNWVQDLSTEPEETHPRCRLAKEFGLKSALGIPIIASDETVAVLVFLMLESREEDKRLVEIVSSVATRLGSVLQHKQAEQALREHEALLQQVIDESTNVIWVKDGEGRYQYVNREFEQIHHVSREQTKGKTDYDLFPKPFADTFRASDLKVLEVGAPIEFEEGGPRDDSTHTCITNKFPIRDASGKVYAVCGNATDITGRKRAEQSLELRVQERTAELVKVDDALQLEIAERTQAEEALYRSREELRALAVRLQAVREKERTVLAREIHDELSGALTALKMDLSLLPDRVARDKNLFLEKLRSMSGLIDHTLDRVHTIVTELRPVVLDKIGLVAAIEWQTGEFQDRSGIVCETHLPTEEIPLDPERSTAVFRILQEALTNVARHANATKVIVELRNEAGSLILTVRENGTGIDEKTIFAHHSMGLLGMRERALSFGGKTEVGRLPGGGTLVSMRIPIE